MAKGSRERTLALLKAIPAAVRAELRPAIVKAAADVNAAQRRAAPRESGGLSGTIRTVMGSLTGLGSSGILKAGGSIEGDPDLTATLIAGDATHYYARFDEFGTKAHTIAPKNAVSLALKGVNGRRVILPPGKTVAHPGAKAHPFFYGPFRARKRAIKSAISRAMKRGIAAAVASSGAAKSSTP